jgi:C-terminal processing protease CtpA/Prc
MKDILSIVKKEVKSNYYDPQYHGIDLEERFKRAEERLDQVSSTSQALSVIAQVLIDFNDSHLFLIPPSTNIAVQYGWTMQAIGDKVYITNVQPGSDAAAQGVKPGDQVLSIAGFKPSKSELWKVNYYYNVLSPRVTMPFRLLSPGSEVPRDVELKAKIKKLPQKITFSTYFRLGEGYYAEENDDQRWAKVGDITIWKMPTFSVDPDLINGFVDRAKSSSGLIIDLRGNGGGYVDSMKQLTGNFFDKDIKICDIKARKKRDPTIAKTRGNSIFRGKLVVLIDSESASASEVFSRIIQLGGRGKIIGDVSAGAVMESVQHYEEMGTQNIVPFAISITDADLIMEDGKSLEHVGVTPDEVVLPTAGDLAADRDVTLARAVAMLGGTLTPEEAGKLFKYYWKD